MTPERRRFIALLRFHVAQQVHTRRWHVSATVLVVVLLLGLHKTGSIFAQSSDALMFAAMIALNFGIDLDRRAHYAAFSFNLASRSELLLTKLIVSTGFLVFLAGILWLVQLFFTRAPLQSLWYTANALLLVASAFGLTLLIEATLDFIAPAAIAVVLLATLTAALIFRSSDPVSAGRTIGLAPTPGSFAALGRLALTDVVLNAMTMVAAITVWTFRSRRTNVASANEHKRT